jgi:hypothetical protein
MFATLGEKWDVQICSAIVFFLGERTSVGMEDRDLLRRSQHLGRVIEGVTSADERWVTLR